MNLLNGGTFRNSPWPFFYFALFIFFFGLFFLQDWSPPVYFFNNGVKSGTIKFFTKKKTEAIQVRSIDLSKYNNQIPLTRNKVVDVQFEGNVKDMWLVVNGVRYELFNFKLIQYQSNKLNFIPLLSIFTASLFVTFGFFFLNSFLFENSSKEKFITLVYSITLILLGFFFLVKFKPGFFNFDSFENYIFASTYRQSAFTGGFYSLMLIAFFQLFHSPYLVSFISILAMALVLGDMFYGAITKKYLKYYIPIILGFLALPTTFISLLISTRDSIANWFLFYAVYKIYELECENFLNRKKIAYVIFVLVVACLLRQEIFYSVIPLMIAYSFFKRGVHFKIAILAVSLVLVAQLIFNRLPFINNKIDLLVYESTVLISPLSEILVTKYSLPLPDYVNKLLGDFFKNDFLITYHSPFEINPFHQGGLNNVSVESYEHFKNGSLKIFMENLSLFFKNSVSVFKQAIGLGDYSPYFLEDGYHLDEQGNEDIRQKKEMQGYTQSFKRETSDILLIDGYRDVLNRYRYLFLSYLPVFVILGLITISSRGTKFLYIFSFLIARTLIVFLTEPASLFKYNYSLYLFAILIIPIFLYQKEKYLLEARSRP